ncbi:kinase-like domain-containing protein [Podospora aff. communis PSN243]|uniref:Kinase-like domain-containing protein n=1 Tax=Podospora aff. communis PSN243 TaxID=3040156 RepID=A0AAV9GPM1_9PEZI|nr:kinase-like domain-containing protein [Podospora aff. communis PSN243]
MNTQAMPALKTVRGFNSTPSASGDEADISDYPSTPHFRGKTPVKRAHKGCIIDDVVSANCSPVLKPLMSPGISGIGKLRMQLPPLSLNHDTTAYSSRASSMTRGSETPGNRSRRPSRMAMRSNSHRYSNSGSGDDTSSEATTSYEIELENDFVCDGRDIDESAPLDGSEVAHPRQKMTAGDFEPLRCLGKGTYGTVLLVKQRGTGRLYAQKQLKKASLVVHKKLIEQTKTERQILESVNRHPFVVKLFYAFQDQEKLYLILEYGQGGELFTHLSTERMFSEQTAAFYMGEMVLALAYLHETLGVVYRDLKPENCLLDAEGHLLLTDFGLSKVAVDSDECKSILGTVEYMAPEIILGKKYGKAVDWWSFGALGFDLMTGNPPFRGANHAKIQDNIVKQKLVMPYFMSPDAKDLLTRLLRKDPAKRLGSNMPKDLTIIKKHRFFRQINWARLEARELEPPIQPLITDPELAENFAPEFTELSLSPVLSRFDDAWSAVSKDNKDDVFGGFSFVASSSLLEGHGFQIPV